MNPHLFCSCWRYVKVRHSQNFQRNNLNESLISEMRRMSNTLVDGVVAQVWFGLITERFVSSLDFLDAAKFQFRPAAHVCEEAISGDKLDRV